VNWEVDLTKGRRDDGYYWARCHTGRRREAQEWHWTRGDFLTKKGVEIPPAFGTDWEVDWSKRRRQCVWARNLKSKTKAAREWRYVSKGTLITGGVKWVRENEGRHLNAAGYWNRTRSSLTDEEIALVEASGLFVGKGYAKYIPEHRLVALKKYGAIPKGSVVRHLNGDKTDNRPENLVLGSHKENHTDHRTAVLNAIYWRERAEAAEKRLADLGL
jgi:hypothetical protein